MAGGGSAAGKGDAPSVRIVVAGDAKTGKSSLILTAATDSFPPNVPPVLPPTRLPDDIYPDKVPVTIIDTSSSPENRGKLVKELKKADAVVLTYACDKPATLDRLSTFWLPELRRLEVRIIEVNTVPGMTPSTVLIHQAPSEKPPLYTQQFFRTLLDLALERSM